MRTRTACRRAAALAAALAVAAAARAARRRSSAPLEVGGARPGGRAPRPGRLRGGPRRPRRPARPRRGRTAGALPARPRRDDAARQDGEATGAAQPGPHGGRRGDGRARLRRPRAARSRLRLRLSGDNFRRAVSVAGSADGREWTTLVDEAWVFAVPGAEAARYETVDLPTNDFAAPPRARAPRTGRAGARLDRGRLGSGRGAPTGARGDARAAAARAPKTRRARDVAGARPRRGATSPSTGSCSRWPIRASSARRSSRRGATCRPATGGREPSRGPRSAAAPSIGSAPRVVPPSVCAWPWPGASAPCACACATATIGRSTCARRACACRSSASSSRRGGPRTYRLVYGSTRAPPEFDLARTVGDVAAWAAGAGEARLGLRAARGRGRRRRRPGPSATPPCSGPASWPWSSLSARSPGGRSRRPISTGSRR